MSPRARSWRSRREAHPRSRWGRCGRGAWRWRSGRTSCAWTRPRRASCLSAAGLDLADAEVAELTEHTEGWSAGLYLAALSAKASGAGAKGATAFPGRRPFRGRLPALGAPLAPAARRAPLPDPDRRSRAHVGSALRRRARVERLRGGRWSRSSAPTCSWCRWTAMGSGIATTISSRSCCVRSSSEPNRSSCRSLLARAPHWCEANGQPEAAIGTRRPPAMSTGRRD